MVRSNASFTDVDYEKLRLSLERYFIQEKRILTRSRNAESTSLIVKLQAKMFAKNVIKEIRLGERFCVAHIWASNEFGTDFMIGKVSRKGVALLMNWFIDKEDIGPQFGRKETLELYKAFAGVAKTKGANRVIAVSNVRDNLFINALETLDFEELDWGKREVMYGKRLSFTDDKKC